jgi:putative hydrolase of the HAD superfamily
MVTGLFDWAQIDTVLLDMDGTLLDLHFDNHFWLEHVPLRYAQTHAVSEAEARALLHGRYRDIQGTLAWYCVDHWSRELGLDIALLKEEIDHLIAEHPHVDEFLGLLEAASKRRVLVTNAHQKSLQLKMRKTRLDGRLDAVVCAHDIGLPKEHEQFWDGLQQVAAFDPDRTLFIDDSLPVLRSAERYGIRHLLGILLPDSRQPLREADEYPAVRDFGELLPALRLAARSA